MRLLTAVCVSLCVSTMAWGSANRELQNEQPVARELKHDLIIQKVTRAEGSTSIQISLFASGFENDWMCWSKGPRIMRMSDASGKQLLAEGRDGELGGMDWEAKRRGLKVLEINTRSDQADGIEDIEIEAEITIARELAYIDLGQFSKEERQIEIAPGAILTFKALIKDRSFSFSADLLDERKTWSSPVLVGLETFDHEGKASEVLGKTLLGFPGSYLYQDGRPMPARGRLVLANVLERIPLKVSTKGLQIIVEKREARKTVEPAPQRRKDMLTHEAGSTLGLVRAAEGDDEAAFEAALNEAVEKKTLGTIAPKRKLTLGLEAMIGACGAGKKARVEKLIELGVVPTGDANEHGNVLTEAARIGSVELVKLMLDKGVDVNAPGRAGNAFFHAAGRKWSPALLELLASRGADVKFVRPRSGLPLVVSNALASEDESLLKAVLGYGAPVDITVEGQRYNALADAILRRNVKWVEMLLHTGVKPGECAGAFSPKGQTATHLELARQMVEVSDVATSREILKLIEEAGK